VITVKVVVLLIKSTLLRLGTVITAFFFIIAARKLQDPVRETRGINQYRLQSRSIYPSVYKAFRRIRKPAQ